MDQKGRMCVGIVGAGKIAQIAARTLTRMTDCKAYAIGSRSLEKAEAFAQNWNMPKAYGSYAEVINDPTVDLIYVATPHSHHYDVTRQALLAGKPCLVEKTFMANCRQTKDIINLAHERKVFIAEAIWTRYQPAVGIVRQLIAEGRIGTPRLITATLAYPMMKKERIFRPDLCGGALLDVGVYALNFVRMFTDAPVVTLDGHCVKSDEGMDLTNTVTMVLGDGIVANLQSSAMCVGDNTGVIAGSDANIVIDNINNPQTITLYQRDRVLVKQISVPRQITGYEYQFAACRQALQDGLLEPREMPHAETLYIMQLMDDLRAKWGVCYPMD